MSRLVLLLLAALAAVLAAACPASARAPRAGRCLPDGTGPRCHFWYGKVVAVDDGDTIDVDLDADGTHRAVRVRFNGIQAMEQSVYSRRPSRRRGECNALEATARLEQLIRRSHRRVRLSAQYASSRQDVRGHARLRRVVSVRSGGAWLDTGLTLLQEGHALWLAATKEDAWNVLYARAEQEARLRGRFLWDPAHCGAGPDADVPLRVWAMWDPLGNDAANLAGEWLKVRNTSATRAVPLARWWVRDAMLRRFTFPAGTVLRPGATLTVHTGRGHDTADDLHWGLPSPVFQNPETARHHLGDGVYLFDPHGDLRAATVYPCLVACTDPLAGALTVTAQPRRPEAVRVRNVSGARADLYGYALALPGSMYDFPPGTVVGPGQTLQVDIGGHPRDDTPLHVHWGVDRYLLPDRGGSVAVVSFSDVTLACDAWGGARC